MVTGFIARCLYIMEDLLMSGFKSIMTISKINAKGGKGVLNQRYQHDFRTRDVPNADMSIKNHVLVAPEGTYNDAFENKINNLDYYKDHDIRKNGVMAYDIFMSFTHDAEKELGFDVKEWEQKSLEWLRTTFNSNQMDKYGDNIISVVCHMDESTPHIHAVVVPIDNRGHLNASYYTGNRDRFFAMQDSYGKEMSYNFGLERGVKYSSATHDTMRKLYAEVREAMHGVEPLRKNEKESVHDFEKRVQEVRETEALAHLKQINDLKRELTAVKDTYRADPERDSHMIRLEKDNSRLREQNEELIHEFGSMNEIRMSCQIIQKLRDAADEYPDKDKYNDTVQNLGEIVEWQSNNKDKKREKLRREEQLREHERFDERKEKSH